MSSTFPEEVEEHYDPAETGKGCLLPVHDTDEGHCDAAEEEDD